MFRLEPGQINDPRGTVAASTSFLPIELFSRERLMIRKYVTAGLIGNALLPPAEFAQTPPATTDRANMAPAAASDSSSYQGNWRASKLVGLSVYNDNNESLGSINDLLTD